MQNEAASAHSATQPQMKHADDAYDAYMVDEPIARYLSRQLGAQCVPGFSDQIGERVIVLDDLQAPAREVLLFRQALTTTPGFEVALRRTVERLRHFQHPAFGPTPSVEYVGHDRSLALVSPWTPGRRLSDVLSHAQNPVLATSLINRLLPALEALNGYGGGIGHGALTASRVVIAPDGQPVIVEHVLGSALERLHLTADASRRDLGIPLPPTEAGRTDFQTDCFQLALIALSMLLGRLLNADDHADLGRALKAAMAAPDRDAVAAIAALPAWLSRALQLDGREFLSGGDARAALRGVAVPTTDDVVRRWRALLEAPAEPVADRVDSSPAVPDDLTPEEAADTAPPEAPQEPAVAPAVFAHPSLESPVPMLEEVQPIGSHDSPRHRSVAVVSRRHDRLRWAAMAVAVCAIVEAFVIAMLLVRREAAAPPALVARVNIATTDPGAAVIVDGQSAGVTPLDLTISSAMRTISVAPAAGVKPELVVGSTGQQNHALDPARTAADRELRAGPAPVPPERVGGIRVSSPIPLDVFEGDRRLGSSSTGIVPAAAGRRELDLVNSVLGFRSRQVVDVRAGQTVALTVSPPNGRININAVPWAEVLIAGKSIGETPIGNFSLPLGEHEIVFRHPQLGEVRRTAIVRVDAVTLVSANLER